MNTVCQQLYQIQQIRQLEKTIVEGYGIDEAALMERAGQVVCKTLIHYWPDASHFVIVCGKGNNAGDGYIAAKYITERGRNVKVLRVFDDEPKGLAYDAFTVCQEAGCQIEAFSSQALEEADVIVDALLGIGLKGDVKEPLPEIIQTINGYNRPVLAVDGPSGLDGDTGQPRGQAIIASMTVTFIGGKCGFYTDAGLSYCGKVICEHLDAPDEAFEHVSPYAWLMNDSENKRFFPPRPRNAHKGHFGRILVIGGDQGMAGAVRMAGEAALRAGAGVVKVATHPDHLAVVSSQRPEVMAQSVNRGDDLNPHLEWSDVIALGPGLGQSEWSMALFKKAMAANQLKVIDADALNLLAALSSEEQSQYLQGEYILTPHPREAARLLGKTLEQVQADRFKTVQQLQQHYGGTVILKGAGSLIMDGEQLTVISAGNPGMATAGMGDVLTGVVAGLLGQKLAPLDAAKCGAFSHSRAADLAAGGHERGLMALDVINYLPQVVNPVPYKIKGVF